MASSEGRQKFLTTFDYTLDYRKGSANGNADILSRWPEPATEHDRTGPSSLIPPEDGGIFLIRACGLRIRASPIPGVGLCGLVPHPESAVLGGLAFASSNFRDFCTHGPRIRIDDLSAPSGRFVARITAAVTTDDCRPGRGELFPAADTAFASFFAAPSGGGTGSAEAPAAGTSVAQLAPPTSSISQGADSAEITDLAASAPSPRGDPAPPTALTPSGRTWTRRRTAAASGTEPPAGDYGFGPGGAPRPSARRTITPPRVPRPRPPLAVATAPAPAASPSLTVPIPSGRDRPEPVGTPIVRLPPSPDVASATPANLDALGDAAESEFGESTALYPHAD